MGVCADPNGVELEFYDKDGKTQTHEPVKGKGLLHSRPRSASMGTQDVTAPEYSLGSTDWLTDVMIADGEDELKKMTPSSTGAALTSTCSRNVQVQWNVQSSAGKVDSGKIDKAVTLAVVHRGEKDTGERLPTKKIYVFPEGTRFDENHPFRDRWRRTIDYLQTMHEEVAPEA